MEPTLVRSTRACAGGPRCAAWNRRALPLLVATVSCTAAFAQDALTTQLNPLGAGRNGVHLYSLYGFNGYFSSPLALNGSPVSVTSGADLGFGGGASIGANFLKAGSGLSVTYTPQYSGFRKNSALNTFNHALTLRIEKRKDPGAKWQTDLGVNASVSDTTQYLFGPTGLSRVVGARASFDDLANAIVAGKFANDEIAAALTGAPLPAAAAQVLLYGNRVMNAALRFGVSYAYSARLNIRSSIGASRFQSLPRDDAESRTMRLMTSSTAGNGMIGLSYSLSPRSQIGGDMSSTRSVSRFQDMYITSGVMTIGRILSRRWFAQARAGAGVLTPVRRSSDLNDGPQFVGGGAIGYKAGGHTAMASFDLLRSDPYGLGAQSSVTSTAAWNWRSRRGWSVSLNANYLRTNGGQNGEVNSWRGGVVLARAVTSQTGVTFGVSALSNQALFTANLGNRVVYGAVATVYWLPGGSRKR